MQTLNIPTKIDKGGPYLLNRVNDDPKITVITHIRSFLKQNKEYLFLAQNKNGSIYAYIRKPRLNKDNNLFKSKSSKCLVSYTEYNRLFPNWENSLIDLKKNKFTINKEYELIRYGIVE